MPREDGADCMKYFTPTENIAKELSRVSYVCFFGKVINVRAVWLFSLR